MFIEKFIENMEPEQAGIAKFMDACDQKVRFIPDAEISDKEHELRVDLINQEVCELFDAMASHNIVEIADALADIIYVVKGTANTYGIDLGRVFNIVQKSNMMKVGPDGHVTKNPLGKVQKPEGWKPPDIRAELKKQGAKL